jgi:predicted alpha/beta hydrolase family esterase
LNKIFFHFGPGGNPEADKEVLKIKSLDFWTQPQYLGRDEYVPYLLKKASERVLSYEKKVELIAHSFGAFIVNNLSSEARSKVSKVSYLAPTFDIFTSITNMINYVLKRNNDSSCTEHFKRLKNEPTSKGFWLLFSGFSSKYPDYLKHYFSTQEFYEKYLSISSKYEGLDEETLIKAVSELIDNYRSNSIQKIYPNSKVYLGSNDPLVPESLQRDIIGAFGKDNVSILNTGHFPHFETNLSL